MNNTAPNFSLIVVAAGSGSRLSSSIPKQYVEIEGRTILRHTLDVFTDINGLKEICVVINPDHQNLYDEAVNGLENISFCVGGETRKDSVYNGLKSISRLNNNDVVLVHDAARPFVTRLEIELLLSEMNKNKAASLAVPVVDTLCYVDEKDIAKSRVSRDRLWAIQTPQAFHYGVLRDAHEGSDPNIEYTDDTALVTDAGIDVKLIEAGKQNFKITTREDLHMAEHMLFTEISTEVRTGLGYDVHVFDEAQGVKSIRLCGVDIAFGRRLKGHSDADVGLHALTDAILGAISEGDIGLHFPPSDNKFKNMDSAVFLEHAMTLLRKKNGCLINADITLICEQPKIGIYREKIIQRVAQILGVDEDCVNIKATTTEKLGFTGREEGIAAQAIVSVALKNGEQHEI